MFEIFVAANFRRSGYSIDLEPSNGKNGFCDLKIWKEQVKAYVECKALNSTESELNQKYQRFITALCEEIWKKTISHLKDRQSIVIQLPSGYSRDIKGDSWIDKILSTIIDEQFDEWRQFNGIKYRIHTGKFEGTLPARHFLIGCGMRLGRFDVQIISAMKGASLRLRKIIKEAKNQLPDVGKGIIVIQTQYSDILSTIVRKNLAMSHYKNVVCIVGIDASYKAMIFENDVSSGEDFTEVFVGKNQTS